MNRLLWPHLPKNIDGIDYTLIDKFAEEYIKIELLYMILDLSKNVFLEQRLP
jgi:hypothetical protein